MQDVRCVVKNSGSGKANHGDREPGTECKAEYHARENTDQRKHTAPDEQATQESEILARDHGCGD